MKKIELRIQNGIEFGKMIHPKEIKGNESAFSAKTFSYLADPIALILQDS